MPTDKTSWSCTRFTQTTVRQNPGITNYTNIQFCACDGDGMYTSRENRSSGFFCNASSKFLTCACRKSLPWDSKLTTLWHISTSLEETKNISQEQIQKSKTTTNSLYKSIRWQEKLVENLPPVWPSHLVSVASSLPSLPSPPWGCSNQGIILVFDPKTASETQSAKSINM